MWHCYLYCHRTVLTCIILFTVTSPGMKELPTPFCGWGKSELTIVKEQILNSKKDQKLGHKTSALPP